MKLIITKRHQTVICHTDFHPNRSRNMAVKGINSLTPVSKVRLSQSRFSWNSRQFDKFLNGTLIPNFMKIQQTVLVADARSPIYNTRTWRPHTAFFSLLHTGRLKKRGQKKSVVCATLKERSIIFHTVFLRSILISNHLNLGLPNRLRPSDFLTSTF